MRRTESSNSISTSGHPKCKILIETTARTRKQRERGEGEGRERDGGGREREKRETEGKQRKDDEKRKERRNDTEEQAILLQALCDRGDDGGNDWLSYLQSDPVMMLVVLLRNK